MLYARNTEVQSYLGSIRIKDLQQKVFYSSLTEFYRKHNARSSFLHRGPILRYIDFFIKTRSPIKGWFRDLSTAQQQNDFYRARNVLNDYVNSFRYYTKMSDPLYDKKNSRFSNIQIQYVSWQQELHANLFWGNRSCINSIYSQQYVGNLQLIRRLFAISWSKYENSIPN